MESADDSKPDSASPASDVDEKKVENVKKSEIIYGINDNPPWYLCIVFAFQHAFLSLGGSIGAPLIIASFLCIPNDDRGNEAKSYLVGSVLVVNGICSFLQATFGTRLPIYQGSSFAFIIPAISILNLPHNKCPAVHSVTDNNVTLYNETLPDGSFATFDDVWMRRLRELQGGLAIASVFEIFLGATGLVGLLTRFFGPLTITTTISLIGISLVEAAPPHAKYHWGVAFFTAFILILCSQFLKNCKVPVIGYSKSKKFHMIWTQPFMCFPVLIALFLGWFLCWILTVAGALSDNPDDLSYFARSDSKLETFVSAPWFRFPYPGQWGMPIVTISAVVGMITAVIASVVESIGDYNACATMCDAPPLPKHAVNRGIMMEGFGCLLAAVVGTSTGTTSYSENIAAIGITRVGSRRVMQVAGILTMVIGFISKIGAFLVSIPEPVFGGIFMVVFGMVIAIGLTNLQYVDLTSNRNIFVIGFSFYMGLMIPYCMKKDYIVINTGNYNLDQTISVILESSLTVGAFVAAFFDNALPGTDEERGLGKSGGRKVTSPAEKALQRKCYDPPMLQCCISRCCMYIPFMPYYSNPNISDDDDINEVHETTNSNGKKSQDNEAYVEDGNGHVQSNV